MSAPRWVYTDDDCRPILESGSWFLVPYLGILPRRVLSEPPALVPYWGRLPAAWAVDWLAASGQVAPYVWNLYQRERPAAVEGV